MVAPTPAWRAELLADAEHVKAFVADPRVRGLADGVLALLDALDAAEAERDAAKAHAARLAEALVNTEDFESGHPRSGALEALAAHDAEVASHG